MKAALWVQNLSFPIRTLEDWAAQVEDTLRESSAAGAEILLMPEYSAAQWLQLRPTNTPESDELLFLSRFTDRAVATMTRLAQTYNTLIVSGTFPVYAPEHNPPLLNRAHVHFPDGRLITQDKLCLTPFEKEPDSWNLSTGKHITLFEYQGWRMAVLICLDIELPGLSALLAHHRIDLLLVPSMTEKPAGYHRVFGCAKARTVELFAAVAVVGCVGAMPHASPEDMYFSGASLFIPCEEELGHTGIAAEIPPSYGRNTSKGELLIADIPLAAIQHLRSTGRVEAWPGNWDASHITIIETP